MLSGLYGNPHSANEPAKVSGEAVDAIREQVLRFFGADPEQYDLVFVANATAGIKLVAEAFRDMAENTRTGTFWYGYHKEAHTSLVGVREYTGGDHHCFEHDADVASFLDDTAGAKHAYRRNITGLGLLAYPGQSNLNGRRLPTTWVEALRESQALQNTYSLFDAAALAMTSPLDHLFADPSSAPDFTVLSFYKIFGFPDLGGLIVRKSSGHILALRKYFGGGTVSMVSTLGPGRNWHKSKALDGDSRHAIHDGLEDGTLPFHSIIALGEAIKVQKRLYGDRCMENISRHTTGLVRVVYEGMSGLRHRNGQQVVHVYCGDADGGDVFGDASRQGATVAFNVLRQDGTWVPYSTVEGMANERGIYVRSGGEFCPCLLSFNTGRALSSPLHNDILTHKTGICCPGGLFSALGYEQWELDRARSAGHYCGSDGETTVIHQLPTGVVRVSIGAMTTMREVQTFLAFLREVFVERDACRVSATTGSDGDSAVAMGAAAGHGRVDSGYAEGGQAMVTLG
jgi:selenocysteine lyase/cysteine desulfurase